MKRWLVLGILLIIGLTAYGGIRVLTIDELAGVKALGPSKADTKCVEIVPDEFGSKSTVLTYEGATALRVLDALKKTLTAKRGWHIRASDDNYAFFTNSTSPGQHDIDWYFIDSDQPKVFVHEYESFHGMKVRFLTFFRIMEPQDRAQYAAMISAAMASASTSPISKADSDLCGAAQDDDLPAAEAALRAGANVNPPRDYLQPLGAALQTSGAGLKVADLLIRKGANVNATDYGVTLLDGLGTSGRPEAIRFLYSRGGRFGTSDQRALFNVCYYTSPVEQNATPEYGEPFRSEGGWTIDAGWKNSAQVAEAMIACGADVNAQDKTHRTPLFYAAKHGNVGVVKVLLEHGAKDFDRKDSYGYTPKSIAIERKRNQWRAVVQLLDEALAKEQEEAGRRKVIGIYRQMAKDALKK